MTPAARRLFFALWPDESIRLALRRAARRPVRQSGGRPVPPGNLHVTLAFLGSIAETRLEAVIRAASAIEAASFELALDTLAFWPRPRVLVLVPAARPMALMQLSARLSEAMTAIGLSMEKRAYRPHLTLVRKCGEPPAALRLAPVRWPVTGFVLAESVTRHTGAEYRVIERFGAGSRREPNGV